MLVPAFEIGRTVAASGDMVGCKGGLNGFGLGGEDPEHRENLMSIYSVGNSERPGRKYFCCPEAAKETYMDKIPVYGSRSDVVVVQPVDEAEEMDAPIEVVVFLVDATELSALITLAGYRGYSKDSVIRSAFGLSCEQVFAMAKQEGESDEPRMVLGMTEFYTRGFIEGGRLTISMPYKMYKRMEADAPESFLKDNYWWDAANPSDKKNCCC
jgi:hypothetical protein